MNYFKTNSKISSLIDLKSKVFAVVSIIAIFISIIIIP